MPVRCDARQDIAGPVARERSGERTALQHSFELAAERAVWRAQRSVDPGALLRKICARRRPPPIADETRALKFSAPLSGDVDRGRWRRTVRRRGAVAAPHGKDD